MPNPFHVHIEKWSVWKEVIVWGKHGWCIVKSLNGDVVLCDFIDKYGVSKNCSYSVEDFLDEFEPAETDEVLEQLFH